MTRNSLKNKRVIHDLAKYSPPARFSRQNARIVGISSNKISLEKKNGSMSPGGGFSSFETRSTARCAPSPFRLLTNRLLLRYLRYLPPPLPYAAGKQNWTKQIGIHWKTTPNVTVSPIFASRKFHSNLNEFGCNLFHFNAILLMNFIGLLNNYSRNDTQQLTMEEE